MVARLLLIIYTLIVLYMGRPGDLDERRAMRSRIFLSLSLVLALILIHPVGASAVPTIDGSLSDWGVDLLASGGPDWTPYAAVAYKVEDATNPSDPTAPFYVGPGIGGQPFDAEAMYAYCNSSDGYLYVAVVSGMPATGTYYKGELYTPGDLAINFTGGTPWEYGVEVTPNPGGAFDQGTLVGDVVWDPPSDFPISSFPASIGDGTDTLEDALFAYSGAINDGVYDHYVIEMGIPVQPFIDAGLWGTPFTLQWTQSCGNDVIRLSCTTTTPPVPEPATGLLFGIGLVGAAFARRRKKRAS